MKKMRRFAAIAAVAAMTACMTVPMMAVMPASAADTATITISGAATGSTYVGYQLMSLTQDGSAYSYKVNSDFSAILQAAAGATTDADVIKYLEDNKDNATVIRDFADAVYTAILAGDYESVELSATAATTVDQGYYLVAEKTTGNHVDGVVDDTFSLVMLDTAGDDNVTVTTKEGTPSLVKKIKDANDSTDTAETVNNWQDSADYDIGDDVPFQLTGTVSSKYGDYNEYYYSFHDTLSSGLTFNNDVVVKVDGNPVTAGYEVVTTNLTDGCTFEVRFADLKKIEGATVTKDSKIVVEYTAELNTGAALGAPGNPNVADLEYSTNPYFTDTNNDGKDDNTGENEDTGFTPEDKVIAFTYKLDVNKVKKDGTALAGAEFSLEKKIGDTWSTLTLVKNDAGTVFTFTGLDDGEYRITETQEPQGYNKLTESIYFTVSATHDVESDDPALTALTNSYTDTANLVTGDVTTGAFKVDVVNESGNILPGTGGIGTTLFYVVGGTLVAGAGVTLIAKKRMKKED